MRMSKTLPFLILPALLAFGGCGYKNPSAQALSAAAASAKTPADHKALAEQYEKLAQDAEAKAAEQQKMLDHYAEHPYMYGKDIYELKDNSTALIEQYQAIAKADRKLAAVHAKLAQGAK